MAEARGRVTLARAVERRADSGAEEAVRRAAAAARAPVADPRHGQDLGSPRTSSSPSAAPRRPSGTTSRRRRSSNPDELDQLSNVIGLSCAALLGVGCPLADMDRQDLRVPTHRRPRAQRRSLRERRQSRARAGGGSGRDSPDLPRPQRDGGCAGASAPGSAPLHRHRRSRSAQSPGRGSARGRVRFAGSAAAPRDAHSRAVRPLPSPAPAHELPGRRRARRRAGRRRLARSPQGALRRGRARPRRARAVPGHVALASVPARDPTDRRRCSPTSGAWNRCSTTCSATPPSIRLPGAS